MHAAYSNNKMKMLLKYDGVIASQESIMSTCYSAYQSDIFKDHTDTIVALGKYNGVDYDIGNRLKQIYESQGFGMVDVNYIQQKILAKDAKKFFILGLCEWKNKAIQANVTTQEKIDLWETTFKNIPADNPSLSFTMARQAYVLARKNEKQ